MFGSFAYNYDLLHKRLFSGNHILIIQEHFMIFVDCSFLFSLQPLLVWGTPQTEKTVKMANLIILLHFKFDKAFSHIC
jgi:hypothetical protein